MKILEVRELTEAEAKPLPKGAKGRAIGKIRDSHHRMAMLYAQGLRHTEVAKLTGRSYNGCLNWRKTPASDELVSQYRKEIFSQEIDKTAYTLELMESIRLLALAHLRDILVTDDETGERQSVKTLGSLVADMSDRTGFGRQSTQVNINVGIGAELEKRRARSKELLERREVRSVALQRPVIDVTPIPVGRLVRRG